MNENIIVTEYEFSKPRNDELDYLLDKEIKDCRKNFEHTFKYRCVYDIEFTNITIEEKVF